MLPDAGWNILDEALCSNDMVSTRADRCCFVLYSLQSRKQAWEHWIQGAVEQQNGTQETLTDSREQVEAASEKKHWTQKLEVQLQEHPWKESSIHLWMTFWEQVETKWNNVF